ncbi:arginine ABC transporter permease ArtQ, partial [Proteus mirabilis]|nr:arginine ABC transporter permease ArtQ [Proteus mirabilis]
GSFTLQFDLGDTESLPFYCGVLALSLLYASYASQTIRGALKAVPTGHWEAGQEMGKGKINNFFRFIMPQMWRHEIP